LNSAPWGFDRALLSSLLSSLEGERASLLGDIHDGAAQLLALAGLKMDLCADLLHTGRQDQAKAMLADARRALSGATKDLRQIMARGRPFLPADESLADALDDLASQFSANLDVPVTVDGELPAHQSEAEALALYRFTQAALDMALVGGEAVEAALHCSPAKMEVTWLRRGDAPSEFAQSNHAEARLRDWAALLGADLEIEREPFRRLTLRLPSSEP
jgi:signal transduction histidine kinase